MNKLIINTANSDLVVCLVKNENIYTKYESLVKKHNERILILIEELLKEHNLDIDEIDEYGVVVGPGSFTGIRVGIATIKAFKTAHKKTAKGINNLNLLAEISKAKDVSFYAIEGSLNSYFVAEKVNNNLYIYPRNLQTDELKMLVRNEKVACFEITENMKNSDINFIACSFDEKAFLKTFEMSIDYNLTPIYYQLSQAENDKINHSEFKICNLEEKDVDKIVEIEKMCFNKNISGDEPWGDKTIINLINDINYKVYTLNLSSQIVGYIVCQITDEINISRVAVVSQFRNHGLATKLINYVENIAKDKNMIVSLEVCEHNITAYKLYTKLGYTIRRIRKDYYKDGSSCIEMIKTI